MCCFYTKTMLKKASDILRKGGDILRKGGDILRHPRSWVNEEIYDFPHGFGEF